LYMYIIIVFARPHVPSLMGFVGKNEYCPEVRVPFLQLNKEHKGSQVDLGLPLNFIK
jgi:hypothetical protein